MERITVPVSIPRDMVPYLAASGQELTFEQSAMLLYPLIQNQSISHGRAAAIVGVRKWDLIEFYDKMGIPYLNQSPEELRDEIAGFDALRKKRTV